MQYCPSVFVGQGLHGNTELVQCHISTYFLPSRDDFERTGLSSLVSVGVRDIQGEGFPDEFAGLTDAVFLDLPQPWLAIPSAAKMLKQDGTFCSFSPCIEQVQRSCETLRPSFTGTFLFFLSVFIYIFMI